MVGEASLIAKLAAVVGREHAPAAEEARRYAVDGFVPQASVQPGTYEEVAAVLRFANEEGLGVIPRGGGYLMHIGNLPRRYDIALSLTRLNGIVEHEAADLTVTCRAGTTVGELQRHLAAAGQMVPFGLNSSDPATVGGQLAANDSELPLAYGTPRDFTIGMRVVTADGRITRAGGKVVKNVAGYDLCKLYIGSLGTLGVIVEATFKVTPLPQARDSIQLEFRAASDACAFAAELQRRGLSLWCLHLRRPMASGESGYAPIAGYVLSVDLAGSRAAVERSAREATHLAREAGAAPFELHGLPKPAYEVPPSPRRDEPLGCAASVLPTQVPALIDAYDREAPGGFISVSPALGTVVSTWLGAVHQERLVERLRAATSALGGTLVVRACPLELKRQIDVFGEPPPSFGLMRRVKEQFDPRGVLSPGRFLGRL